MSECKYHCSYYYWSLYCYLATVMIRKYLKSDTYWSIVEYSPWFLDSAKLYNENRYFYVKLPLSRTLDFLCFFDTGITSSAHCAIITFGACPDASIDWWEIFFIIEFHTYWWQSKSLCGNNFMDTLCRQYAHVVGKYEICIYTCIRALETWRNASIYLTCTTATGNKSIMFWQYTYIVSIV